MACNFDFSLVPIILNVLFLIYFSLKIIMGLFCNF